VTAPTITTEKAARDLALAAKAIADRYDDTDGPAIYRVLNSTREAVQRLQGVIPLLIWHMNSLNAADQIELDGLGGSADGAVAVVENRLYEAGQSLEMTLYLLSEAAQAASRFSTPDGD